MPTDDDIFTNLSELSEWTIQLPYKIALTTLSANDVTVILCIPTQLYV